ncbi:MAG: hypothetical protein ACI85F_002543 [Bacteroidia bacterium]|jgi:hypothetical protein
MKILFTFILTVACGATSVYAQNSNTAVKNKAKAEVSQSSKTEFKATDANQKASSFTKDNLRTQENKATKSLNSEIDQVNKEIKSTEINMKSRSNDKSYNSQADKTKLESLKAKKHELNVKTL